MHTQQLVEICDSMRQGSDAAEGVQVHMRLHYVYDNGWADRDEISAVVVTMGLVDHMVLYSDKLSSVRPLTGRSTTNLG